jgi:hypothetical protein
MPGFAGHEGGIRNDHRNQDGTGDAADCAGGGEHPAASTAKIAAAADFGTRHHGSGLPVQRQPQVLLGRVVI